MSKRQKEYAGSRGRLQRLHDGSWAEAFLILFSAALTALRVGTIFVAGLMGLYIWQFSFKHLLRPVRYNVSVLLYEVCVSSQQLRQLCGLQCQLWHVRSVDPSLCFRGWLQRLQDGSWAEALPGSGVVLSVDLLSGFCSLTGAGVQVSKTANLSATCKQKCDCSV